MDEYTDGTSLYLLEAAKDVVDVRNVEYDEAVVLEYDVSRERSLGAVVLEYDVSRERSLGRHAFPLQKTMVPRCHGWILVVVMAVLASRTKTRAHWTPKSLDMLSIVLHGCKRCHSCWSGFPTSTTAPTSLTAIRGLRETGCKFRIIRACRPPNTFRAGGTAARFCSPHGGSLLSARPSRVSCLTVSTADALHHRLYPVSRTSDSSMPTMHYGVVLVHPDLTKLRY